MNEKIFEINWTNQSAYGNASLANMENNMLEANLVMGEKNDKREDTVWWQKKEDLLAELWQDRPCLFVVPNPDCCDRNQKAAAYGEIAKKLNSSSTYRVGPIPKYVDCNTGTIHHLCLYLFQSDWTTLR